MNGDTVCIYSYVDLSKFDDNWMCSWCVKGVRYGIKFLPTNAQKVLLYKCDPTV